MMNAQQKGRRDRMIQSERHDTYRSRGKFAEPTVCTGCGALYQEGRWAWKTPPATANRAVCPACQRTADRLPAGRIEIGGPFFREHRGEIINLIRNEESAEKGERPMERIMAIAEEGERALVTTTGVHLARRIGESLSRSYQGEYGFRYSDNEDFIRVTWSR